MPTVRAINVGGKNVAISNASKVYFPASGFTKGAVLAYYADMAAVILPHLKNRPLTLKRYPDGIDHEPFYEKNAPAHTPPWIKRCEVTRSEGGIIHYILCNDQATLLWLTNLGDIEKHIFLARVPHLERPDSVVFDLDPGDGAGIIDCGVVALHLRGIFESLGLQSFVKVSGSKGLHLAVPINGDISYDIAQPFAKAVAELAARQMPDLVVSQMAKSLRRGRVLIDWSQNSESKTTVCVYAMRAKAGGPHISLPITWVELEKAVKRHAEQSLTFTPAQAVRRIERLGDLFAPVLKLKQKLPRIFTEALAGSPKAKATSWRRTTRKGDTSMREYAARRDHSRTPEPVATPGVKSKSPIGVHRFVIQKHDASHLHYDWRLEMEGVLRSWAVPKGPPTELRQARLAMHVEDHPLDYADFEGTIPAGNYGAGTVMVWDQGEYEDLTGDPASAFAAGKMHLIMRGSKLKGEWILVKDRREEGNRWLLIKAGVSMKPLSAASDDRSSLTRRSMRAIKIANDAQWHSHRPAG